MKETIHHQRIEGYEKRRLDTRGMYLRYWVVESDQVLITMAVIILLFFQIMETWLPFDKRYRELAGVCGWIKIILLIYFIMMLMVMRISRRKLWEGERKTDEDKEEGHMDHLIGVMYEWVCKGREYITKRRKTDNE